MRVLITGGCGFIGLAAAKALRERGHDIRLLSSRREGLYEGFEVVRGDVRDVSRHSPLLSAVDGIDAAIIAHQFPGFPIESPATHDTFDEVDRQGTLNIISLLRARSQPQKFIYLSGAAVQDSIPWRKHPGIDAKRRAEDWVRRGPVPWTILRASIVYGPGDHYFSRLAQMIRTGPVVPVFGDGRALSAPIHVNDLAMTIAASLEDSRAENALLDACGPNTLSTNAVLDLLMSGIGQRRPVLHLPLGLMNTIASVMERLAQPPLTRGLIAFSLFDNSSHGINADLALGLTFRDIDTGIRQVYGKPAQ